MMKIYDLIPKNGRKSFYGKAKIYITGEVETLYSYNTPIVKKDAAGKLTRLYTADPSNTTCAHIFSFCGLRKSQFLKLEEGK